MAQPICPVDYTCQFTLNHPRVVIHQVGPWYHTWLLPVLIVVIVVVIGIVLLLAIDAIDSQMSDKRQRKELQYATEQDRKQQLALEEQRTMQLDAAKGNPEMLKIIRDWERS